MCHFCYRGKILCNCCFTMYTKTQQKKTKNNNNKSQQTYISSPKLLGWGRAGRAVLSGKLSGGVQPTSQNRYPLYDRNLRFLLPYL